MADDTPQRDAPFLKRWSQRKLAASREAAAPRIDPAPAPAPAPVEPAPPAASGTPSAEQAKPELPPVESLTFDSDFTAFLKPDVDDSLRRTALRKLFSDPHFNVMDGLDVYIDDYNKTVPIPEDMVAQLAHARYLFDPPKTRVNAMGYVEDVPEEDANVAASPDAAQVPQDAHDDADSGRTAADNPNESRDAAPERLDVASAAPPATSLPAEGDRVAADDTANDRP